MKDLFMPGLSALPAPAIDRALASLESRYAETGRGLESVQDELARLQGIFDELATAFGPASRDAVRSLTDAVSGRLHGIETGFSAFLADIDQLALAVGALRGEVSDLDRTVRTLSNLAVSARLHGHALVPPRPQVRAFVMALSTLAEAAEQARDQVRTVMDHTTADLAALAEEGDALRKRLTTGAMPLLRELAEAGARRLHDQDAIGTVTGTLASRMSGIGADVSRLAVALQSGDATRQRLERARAILAPADADAASLGARARLAAALIRAAHEDCAGELSTAADALERTGAAALEAIGDAHRFYLAPAGAMGIAAHGKALSDEMQALSDSLTLIETMTTRLADRLATLFGLGDTLRGIAQEVRLSGLNAALVCAKLGREGLPLREIARWLRELTDSTDGSIRTLQDLLGAARCQGERMDAARIETLMADLSEATGQARLLVAEIAAGETVMIRSARQFETASGAIPASLDLGASLLREVARDQSGLPGLTAILDMVAESADQTDPMADPDIAATLQRLRALYTMERERVIHDRLFPAAGMAGQPAALPKADAAPADPDDLSDILF